MQQQPSQVLVQTGLCQPWLAVADSSRPGAVAADGPVPAPQVPRAEHAGHDRMSESVWGDVYVGGGGSYF